MAEKDIPSVHAFPCLQKPCLVYLFYKKKSPVRSELESGFFTHAPRNFFRHA